jgi:hypothetical protein
MPNDEKEQEHMDILGNMFNLVLGGKPFLAPIEHPQRILDLGTGTGSYLRYSTHAGVDCTNAEQGRGR